MDGTSGRGECKIPFGSCCLILVRRFVTLEKLREYISTHKSLDIVKEGNLEQVQFRASLVCFGKTFMIGKFADPRELS